MQQWDHTTNPTPGPMTRLPTQQRRLTSDTGKPSQVDMQERLLLLQLELQMLVQAIHMELPMCLLKSSQRQRMMMQLPEGMRKMA